MVLFDRNTLGLKRAPAQQVWRAVARTGQRELVAIARSRRAEGDRSRKQHWLLERHLHGDGVRESARQSGQTARLTPHAVRDRAPEPERLPGQGGQVDRSVVT